MKKNLFGVGFSSAVGLVIMVSFVAFTFFPPAAKAQTVFLGTGWEDGQTLGIADKVLYSKDVTGYFNSSSPPPECSRRRAETVRSGSYSLTIAGYSKAGYAYCYYQIFNQKITVENGMKIGYWIYHAEGTPKVGVDGRFTDGNTIRDFGGGALKDQNGVRIHPAARKAPMNQWVYVEVDLTPAAGKTLDYIMFAFDNGNDGFTGPYRAYVDDFKIFTGGTGSCQASVPADRWKGEYFTNLGFSGTPAMVRDDGNGFLDFDWGTGSPNPACGVPVDNFSARWTRTVNFPGGNYKFTATADDGVRVWIDNQLQLDKWIDQSPTSYTFGPISLTGNHTIKMEYYERGGGATAKLSWETTSNPCQASVSAENWKGEYFNNVTLSGSPVMVRDDGNGFVSFDWGEGSPSPSCGVPVDNFSARFTRTVNFAQGSYQFSATADDGVRVWIDDQLQLDKWIDQGPTAYTFGPVFLTGNHTIRMEYYERGGGAVAKLSWQGVANPCQASVPADHWKGEYFNNLGLSGTPAMVRDDGNGFVSFDWGDGSPSPSCGVPVDNFSARFTRIVNFSQGSYQFTVTVDDGVRVWIDDQLKLDKWIEQAPTKYTIGPIDLTGNHTIKMEYYEKGGGAVAKLSWATIASGELEWPNSVSYANSDPWLAEHHREIRRMRPRILALNFVNQKSMDQMRTHMQQAIAAIAEGSRYHGYKDANAPVFIQYELAYAIDLRDPVPLPNFPYHNSSLYPRENPVVGWGLDYGKLFSAEFAQMYRIPDPNDASRFLTLCELIERGLVHEVWIYGDQDVPDVSAAEVLELKPYYDENRQRAPGAMNPCAGNGCFDGEDVVQMNCSRTVRIAWMNNTRGAGCFLESLSHGMESFGAWNRNQIPYLSRYFVPFANYGLNTKYGLPTDSWYACSTDDCLRYPTATSVTYNLPNQGKQGVINPYDPVCGNVHFPPNGRSHYDLGSPYTVRTSCGHYRDGSGLTDDFTIEAFTPYNNIAGDCDGPFLVWWRQNMPGLDNNARDDQGNPMLNWWPFLFY